MAKTKEPLQVPCCKKTESLAAWSYQDMDEEDLVYMDNFIFTDSLVFLRFGKSKGGSPHAVFGIYGDESGLEMQMFLSEYAKVLLEHTSAFGRVVSRRRVLPPVAMRNWRVCLSAAGMGVNSAANSRLSSALTSS